MSIELLLQSFHDGVDDETSLATLKHLAEIVRQTLLQEGGSADDVQVSREQVMLELPGGPADIRAHGAIFPIVDLDLLTLHVIFDVAKAGDMVIITEGGDYSAIILEPSQRARLPEEDWQAESASPICRSPGELKELLESWYRMHTTFRDQAVADWTSTDAKNHMASKPASGVTTYRWDASRNQLVEVTKDAEYVYLYRFDPSGNEIPQHPGVLQELKTICEDHLRSVGDPNSRLVEGDWPPLSVRFPDYSADVWPARAGFNFYDLTPDVANLMFDVSRAGNMSILTPNTVILTQRDQRERLPQSWKNSRQIFVCENSEKLRSLVMTSQVDISLEERNHALSECINAVPGTFASRPRVIYIEAKPHETAVEHQKKVFKRESQNPNGPENPESGMLMSSWCQLETPRGRRFFAYSYGGEGWLPLLRDFANSEGRMVGSIVNFETFIQDDGDHFPVSDCDTRKVDSTTRAFGQSNKSDGDR